MRRRPGAPSVLLLALAAFACRAATAPEPPPAESIRVATYNVEGLGRPGSASWRALVAVLRRLGADLVLVQEITEDDGPRRVRRLAEATGYADLALSEVHGTLSGGLRSACLSRSPIVESRSWSAATLAGDPRANDIGRDILSCRIRGRGADLVAVTVHWKAGGGAANDFRRRIEARRLGQAIDRLRRAAPQAALVVAGDFNEDPRFTGAGRTFRRIPPGLPPTFRLGADLRLPIGGAPFSELHKRGFRLVRAVREDAPNEVVTHPPTRRRIDLLWVEERIRVERAVVYDGCRDDGVDDPPPGDFMPLSGEPLDCAATARAADHLPVAADLVPPR
ncbi:MAG: hypothetical protein D6718_07225 [Acidobacteria bacterium]|nr:MAG: hypothetical protein D6718_07225 [Acidobacteriota bacterium]